MASTLDNNALCHVIEKAYLTGAFPGGSVAIIKDDTPLCSSVGVIALGSRTKLTHVTKFPLACLGEVILLLVGSELSAKGVLDWDEPLSIRFPQFASQTEREGTGLTARHLLVHSSGLDHPLPSHEQFRNGAGFAIHGEAAPLFSPGQFFSRSTYNSRLLHRLFDTISPQCVEAFLRRLLPDLEVRAPLFSPDTTGHIFDKGVLVPIERSNCESRTIEDVSLGTLEIAQLGHACLKQLNSAAGTGISGHLTAFFLQPFSYAVNDISMPYSRCSPWYQFSAGSYFCAGHHPGHNLFLFISQHSNLSLAVSVNSNSFNLAGALISATNVGTPGPPNTGPTKDQSHWHVCTDEALVCGSYAAHGQTIHIRRGKSHLQISGTVYRETPPIEHDDDILYLREDGYFSTSPSPNNARITRVRFISLESSLVPPTWMRLHDQMHRRVR